MLYDAHNHLQDARFGGRQETLMAECRAAGVRRMVVNGATEADWPDVAALARAHPRLRAVVLEKAAVAPLARRFVAAEGMAARVQVRVLV